MKTDKQIVGLPDITTVAGLETPEYAKLTEPFLNSVNEHIVGYAHELVKPSIDLIDKYQETGYGAIQSGLLEVATVANESVFEHLKATGSMVSEVMKPYELGMVTGKDWEIGTKATKLNVLELLNFGKATETELFQVRDSAAKALDLSMDSRVMANELFVAGASGHGLIDYSGENESVPITSLYNDSVVNLRTLDSSVMVNPFTTVGIELESVDEVSQIQASLSGVATMSTQFGSIGFEQTAGIDILFSRFESKMAGKLDEVSEEMNDLKDMIKQLSNGSKDPLPAKIIEIKFDIQEVCLKINGKTIEFTEGDKQTVLCKMFLSSPDGKDKKLHIEDILDIYGGADDDSKRNWNKKFYQAARHLNDKIQGGTGLEKFIKVSGQYYEVNPKYRDMF